MPSQIGRDDVVVIPAFGIPAAEIDLLSKKGCIIVDTTCGSVLNVWKNVGGRWKIVAEISSASP